VTINKKEEVEVIKEVRPKNILISYWYFKNRNLQEWVKDLGYLPNIMLDSGAWSAYNQDKRIDFKKYIDYINKYKEYIYEFVNLDEIGDPDISYWSYLVMKKKGLNPIPVYHYGEDFKYLDAYIKRGEKRIAFGGTVMEKDKIKVANIASEILKRYPQISLHLLGSSSKKLIQYCPEAHSCDSSTWMKMAINGFPKHIEGKTYEAKKERMKYWMLNIKDLFNEDNPEIDELVV
jgi:hypothetical protein